MRSRLLILIVLSLWGVSLPLISKTTKLWDSLELGSHSVGFSVTEESDGTRTFLSGSARSIRIYMWYPATPAGAPPIPFKKYLVLANSDFVQSQMGPQGYDPAIPIVRGLTAEKLKQLEEKKTAAVLNGKAKRGSFPLILVGQGLYYESPVTHALLCEYLASHGYVVATCPLVGTDSRYVRLNPVDLDSQVRDLEFVMDRVKRLGNVSPVHTGFLGFDMGGMAGLVFSMKNPMVKAFLSMDAGILFPHFSNLPGNSPHYNEDKFLIPWMHLTQSRFYHTAKQQNPDLLSLYERKEYGDSYLLLFDGVNHASFTSYALMKNKNAVPAYWGPDPAPEKNPSSGETYGVVCRMVAEFFNRYLKGNQWGQDFFEKDQKKPFRGIPVEIKHKAGKNAPLGIDEFIGNIFDEGIEKAISRLKDEMALSGKSGGFTEPDINQLGYKFLYFWGRPKVALAVFLLNVDLHPQSGNVYDSLAEAYLFSGNRELAIKNYQKSLTLDPKNTNARDQLKRLLPAP